jgi:hypothetical protein
MISSGVFLDPSTWVHLDWVLLVVAAWLLIGVAGMFALHRLAWWRECCFLSAGPSACCCSASL